MSGVRGGGWWLGAALLGLVLGCAEERGVVGVAGSGGSLADAGGSGGAAGALQDAAAGGAAGAEPVGDDVLSLVHGVVDAPRIAFCFARRDGAGWAAQGAALPAGGLASGTGVSLRELPGVDPTRDDVVPLVVASASANALSLQRCEDVARQVLEPPAGPGRDAEAPDGGDGGGPAEPPLVRHGALPVLPAGSLSGGRSVLLVAIGCVGGADHTDPQEEAVCGAGYRPDAPSLSLALVRRTRRVVAGAVGLQALNASTALDAFELASEAGHDEEPRLIAPALERGVLAPRPPRSDAPAALWQWTGGSLAVGPRGGKSRWFTERWSTALERGGATELRDGTNYVVVVTGPRAGVAAGPWWSGPRLSVFATE